MENIVDISYIEQIGIKKENISKEGNNSTINILNNGKKYKLFNKVYHDLKSPVNQELKNNLLEQTKEKTQYISFPELVIADQDRLYGIIGNYEPGVLIDQINPLIYIEELIYLLKLLEEDIKTISTKGWYMEDLNPLNVLINFNEESPKALKVIDTDFYMKKVIKSKEEQLKLYQKNLSFLFKALYYALNIDLYKSSIWNNSMLQIKYHQAIDGFIECSELIEYIIEIIKSNSKEDINTLQNLRKTLNTL